MWNVYCDYEIVVINWDNKELLGKYFGDFGEDDGFIYIFGWELRIWWIYIYLRNIEEIEYEGRKFLVRRWKVIKDFWVGLGF